jgi:hypothetical protein
MGKVFKVRSTISDRVAAIKVLLPELDPSRTRSRVLFGKSKLCPRSSILESLPRQTHRFPDRKPQRRSEADRPIFQSNPLSLR